MFDEISMALNYRHPAYLLISAALVFLFDRFRYSQTFESNKAFLNEALIRNEALPEGYEGHFRLLSAFENIELALYIFIISLGFAILRTSGFIKSFMAATGLFLAGAIIGRMLSRTEPIRIDFLQTYMIAAVASAAILLMIHLLVKGIRNGPN